MIFYETKLIVIILILQFFACNVEPIEESLPQQHSGSKLIPQFSSFNSAEIDLNDDIIVLNNPNGASGFGHTAVLIGDDTRGWKLISKEGRVKEPWYSNELTGGPALKPLIKEFKTLNDFREAQKNDPNLSGYTQDIRFKTNKMQDEAATEATMKSAQSWYNATWANCGDAVSHGLEAAGLDPGYRTANIPTRFLGVPSKSLNPRPNVRFEEIIENNKENTIPTDL